MDAGSLLYDSDFQLKSGQLGYLIVPEDVKTIPNGRCIQLNFLAGHTNRPGPITLTIPQLEISPPEVIPDAEIKAAQQKLQAQGIELDYSFPNPVFL